MTISKSSTVYESLKRAKRQGKRFSVVCPESRPLNEGVGFARELGKLGVSVTLCADALAPSLVDECDLMLIGGDALASEGLVNKIGTYPLALAARRVGVPFIALISTQKHLGHFDSRWIAEMDPKELFSEPIENIRVCNRYFDLTPLDLITRIVTERGIYSIQEIREVLEQQ
jgi:translation initiation factor 2B subunit (eIF-2B alpha/beta/delta family)